MATRGRGLSGGLLAKNNNNSSKLPKLRAGAENFGDTCGFDIGICSAQGRRPYQEDEFAIATFLNRQHSDPSIKISDTHLFGVFDGHAGGRCSKAISLAIPENLVKDPKFDSKLAHAIRGAFSKSNENFLKIAERMRLNDGSTAVCCVLRYLKLVVANVGDSRAILLSGNKAHQITTDHKPSSPDEQRRIASIGGSVVNCMGVARVNGILAVSRAFGNFGIRHVIRPDADIFERDIISDDDFLVLGSDGLWDVLRNKDVCDITYSLKAQGMNAQKISEELVKQALSLGSMDNITCMVVGIHEYYLQTKELVDKIIKNGSDTSTNSPHPLSSSTTTTPLPLNTSSSSSSSSNLPTSGLNVFMDQMDQTIDYDSNNTLTEMTMPPTSDKSTKSKKISSHLFPLNTNISPNDIISQRYSPLATGNSNSSYSRPPVVGQVILLSNASTGEKPPINSNKYNNITTSGSSNDITTPTAPPTSSTSTMEESPYRKSQTHYTGYAAPRLLSGNNTNSQITHINNNSNTEESKTGNTPPIASHIKSSLSIPSNNSAAQGILETNLPGESFRAKYTIQSQKLQHNILASTLPLPSPSSAAATTTTRANKTGKAGSESFTTNNTSTTTTRNEAQKLRQTITANTSDSQHHNSLPRSAPSSSFSNGLRSTAGNNALRQDNSLQLSSGNGGNTPPSLFVGKASTNKGIGFAVDSSPTVGSSTITMRNKNTSGNTNTNTSNNNNIRLSGKGVSVDDSPQYSESEFSNTDNTVMMFSKRKHMPSTNHR